MRTNKEGSLPSIGTGRGLHCLISCVGLVLALSCNFYSKKKGI